MSVFTTLLLTGLGGMFHKYDSTQKYEMNLNVDIPVRDYKEKVLMPNLETFQERGTTVAMNFFPDLMNNQPFIYPIKGFIELLYHPRKYLYMVSGTFILYLASFIPLMVLYWLTITPMYFAFLAVLGPFGCVLAILQSFLQGSLLTMMFLRFSFFRNNMVKTCMDNNSEANDSPSGEPVRLYVPVRCTYFWLVHLPTKIIKYFLGFITLISLMAISALPIVGPIMFHMLISPFLSKIYISNLLRMKGFSNEERMDYLFQRLGTYTSFGIMAGLLETIPIFSGLALSANIIGMTLLGLDTLPDMGESNSMQENSSGQQSCTTTTTPATTTTTPSTTETGTSSTTETTATDTTDTITDTSSNTAQETTTTTTTNAQTTTTST